MIDDLDLCVIRLGKGDRLSKDLVATLDPIEIGTFHYFNIPSEKPTELHYHDFDEYWLFTEGKTTVTLRLPNGTKRKYEIEGINLIVTPKGAEHGHMPSEPVKGIEFTGKKSLDARRGHLRR